MKVTIAFKNLDHTPAIDQRIHEKSQKIGKLLDGNSRVKWTCYVQEGKHHAEVVLWGPKYEYHATAHSDNLYKTLDMVVLKLQKQLCKQKEKWKNRIHTNETHQNLVILDVEEAWTDYDEDYFKDAA